MKTKLPPPPPTSTFDATAQDRFTSEGAPAPAATRDEQVFGELAVLTDRLAKAERDRDTWRAAGRQENYLGACSLVDALNLQIDDLRVHTIHSRRSPAGTDGRERVMAELGIRFNGRSYQYRSYRYDSLADAVNYARLEASRPAAQSAPADFESPEEVQVPSEVDRGHMHTFAITLERGVFCLGEYRYDRLADAIAYAKRGAALMARRRAM